MHLATIVANDNQAAEIPVFVDPERGAIPASALDPHATGDLLSLIRSGRISELTQAATDVRHVVYPRNQVRFTAPYRHPRMIWGIGLNYVDHATDLSVTVPDEPASFIKGDQTIIGPGEPIPLPQQSLHTTSEAEMGMVIGRYGRNVPEAEALDYVLGVVPVLDQTAEDILHRNPRFLTRAKNFPGFFSFGPEIVPLQEAIAHAGSLADIEVSTVVNGTQTRTNTVAHMRFSPAHLIAFHSEFMPLYPGDIISPGTPGAIHVQPGDSVECRIPGVGILRNDVVRA